MANASMTPGKRAYFIFQEYINVAVWDALHNGGLLSIGISAEEYSRATAEKVNLNTHSMIRQQNNSFKEKCREVVHSHFAPANNK
jgi:hypothetical protein